MDKYLNILIDSLRKKNTYLDEIQKICDEQDSCVGNSSFSLDDYNALMERKRKLMEQMDKLDDGFTALYTRISPQLKQSQTDYSEQIIAMQKLITVISEKIALVQAKELRIQGRIDRMIESEQKSGERHVPRSDAARKYYQTMKGTTVTSSIFVDSKKRGGK